MKKSLEEAIESIVFPVEAVVSLSEGDYFFSIPDKKMLQILLKQVRDFDLSLAEEEGWVIKRLEEGELPSVPLIIECFQVTFNTTGEVFQHSKGLEIKEPEYTFADLEKTVLRKIRHILEAVNSIGAPQPWLRYLKPSQLIYKSNELTVTRSCTEIFGKDRACHFWAKILFNGRTLLDSEIIGLTNAELIKFINKELVNFTGNIGPWQCVVAEAGAVEKFRLIDFPEVRTIAGKLGLVS